MILVIDNYDSFTYNLVQYIGSIIPDVKVVRNDKFNLDEIYDWNPTHIVISPGPGRPEDAGLSINVIKIWTNNSNTGSLPGASGHYSSLWGQCYPFI